VKVGDTEVAANVIGFIDTSKNVVIGPSTEINKINTQLGCRNQRQGSTEICAVIEVFCDE
jgi:hypothetical protein